MSNTFPSSTYPHYQKLRSLLKRLADGVIEMEEAESLKLLLEIERENAIKNEDYHYENYLNDIINILDSFIADEINLQLNS